MAEKCAVDEAAKFPDDLSKKLWAWTARKERCAIDIASLAAKVQWGLIDKEEFVTKNKKLLAELDSLHKALRLPNSEPPLDVRLCIVDIISIKLMYGYQTTCFLQDTDILKLERLALMLCCFMRWMEEKELSTPTEFALLFRGTLRIAAPFLPKHVIIWARWKLAMIEQCGCVSPPAFRTRMAKLWKDDELTNWWLAENKGYPRLVREIREWVEHGGCRWD
ncbi:hypothetical protein AJ80_10096 [Polytolypa hystricis UAMH7299]|uniref:Uncharacterized protein n=1 Tax=Polytolypa hystricis (strain UAMH7299) TaxID=1447883 RepID=A0A2B7W5Y1_POLH7|nr:hypothetical protein AJ80_10096 [Polytolypa hystricis UAMH7299]